MELPHRLPLLLSGGTELRTQNHISSQQDLLSFSRQSSQAGCHGILLPFSSFSHQEAVAAAKTAFASLSVGVLLPPAELSPEDDPTFQDFKDIFSPRSKKAVAAGADFFLLDQMTSLLEARAAVLACRKRKLPIFATLVVDEDGCTPQGDSALSCLVVLQELGISGFGVVCPEDPKAESDLLSELASFAKIPLLAQIGQGDQARISQQVTAAQKAGAQIICAFTAPHQLKMLQTLMEQADTIPFLPHQDHHDLVLANRDQVFLLDNENVDFSNALQCSVDMADALLEAEDEGWDLLLIEVHTPEDAYLFAQNAHFARLPVAFFSESELALKSALLSYPGRALVDSTSPIDPQTLEKIARKYGAVVF